MRHWSTVCDAKYLTRLKALLASMRRHCGDFRLHVLAWDLEVFEWAGEEPDVDVYDSRILSAHLDFLPANMPGAPRSVPDQMRTIRPLFTAEVIRHTKSPVTQVDADLFFFSSPADVFAEIGKAPAAVILNPGGSVDAGMVYIADAAIADHWARCMLNGVERCLDVWPQEYGAHVVKHPAVNVGPFALARGTIENRGGRLYFDGVELVAVHYSGLDLVDTGDGITVDVGSRVTPEQARLLYSPYLDALAGREPAALPAPPPKMMTEVLVREWRGHLQASLEGWREPDGFLVPTEPDEMERELARRDLKAAIHVLARVLGEQPTG